MQLATLRNALATPTLPRQTVEVQHVVPNRMVRVARRLLAARPMAMAAH